ncbi:MAG: hypothetical protein BWY96_02440 [Spirochaetes bacterium ADurb.BinA120]|nr:MAG: hypothetical protein BWY96_02440 [Spirochaetes bacterium ADurb.BinA120]
MIGRLGSTTDTLETVTLIADGRFYAIMSYFPDGSGYVK